MPHLCRGDLHNCLSPLVSVFGHNLARLGSTEGAAIGIQVHTYVHLGRYLPRDDHNHVYPVSALLRIDAGRGGCIFPTRCGLDLQIGDTAIYKNTLFIYTFGLFFYTFVPAAD